MATEQLDVSLVENLKTLSAKKNELVLKAGQIHLEIKELNNISNRVDTEYLSISSQLDSLLADLQAKYPNGEIDLVEGTVTF
jgi:hypothetical protein